MPEGSLSSRCLLNGPCLRADDPAKARLFHEERARVNASDPYAIFLRCRHCASLHGSAPCRGVEISAAPSSQQ